jgi:hypothetical protein
MPIKVLYPLKACLVIGPAIFRYCNSPIAREVAFLIPTREIILTRNNDKRRQRPPFRIDRLNRYNPFSVSRLNLFRVLSLFYAYNNHTACNNTYHKASLIKVI